MVIPQLCTVQGLSKINAKLSGCYKYLKLLQLARYLLILKTMCHLLEKKKKIYIINTLIKKIKKHSLKYICIYIYLTTI